MPPVFFFFFFFFWTCPCGPLYGPSRACSSSSCVEVLVGSWTATGKHQPQRTHASGGRDGSSSALAQPYRSRSFPKLFFRSLRRLQKVMTRSTSMLVPTHEMAREIAHRRAANTELVVVPAAMSSVTTGMMANDATKNAAPSMTMLTLRWVRNKHALSRGLLSRLMFSRQAHIAIMRTVESYNAWTTQVGGLGLGIATPTLYHHRDAVIMRPYAPPSPAPSSQHSPDLNDHRNQNHGEIVHAQRRRLAEVDAGRV